MLTTSSHVRRIDSQLDGLQLCNAPSTAESLHSLALSDPDARDRQPSTRVLQLQSLIKALSLTSSSRPKLLSRSKLCTILSRAELSSSSTTSPDDEWDPEDTRTAETDSGQAPELYDSEADPAHGPRYERELEWLLVSKVAVQAYGQILDTILEQTLALSEDVWYWDDVLGSYAYAGLYTVQTSPLRVWGWSKEVYAGVTARGGNLAAVGWKRFYALVREVVRDRSVVNLQRRVVAPLSRVRNEALRRQAALKKVRQMNANALGILMGEGLSHER